ncbi:M48 family metallopeptidase [Rickettsiales bacterium]|nr:M48 family metallopeptidase [Rickettsiales bacterium]
MKNYTKIMCIIVILQLIGCVSPKTNYPTIDQHELQLETQRHNQLAADAKLKKELAARRKFQDKKNRLFDVSSYILTGGVRLCKKMNLPVDECFYEFELLDSGTTNAYTDGKKIFITTAMMNFCKTDEELAIVLGHEYAHNIMGHIKSKQTNMLFGSALGVLLDAAASSQGIETGSAFNKLGSQVGALSYSQEFEKEADYVGLYITSISGYNVDTAPDFWRRMSIRDHRSINSGRTHPSNPARTLALSKVVQEIANKKKAGLVLTPDIKLRK